MATTTKDWYSLAEIWELHKDEIIKSLLTRGELNNSINGSGNYFGKLAALKKYYQDNESKIRLQHEKCPQKFFDIYPTDWHKVFSHIERYAWNSIRCKGLIVLYPQYPALDYFLDFANPGFKVALELDGKEFHNKQRDLIRDVELRNDGWTIYRITGKEMMRTNYKELYEIEQEYNNEHQDENQVIEDLQHWLFNTGDGVIEAIKHVHFSQNIYLINDYIGQRFDSLCYQTLQLHQSSYEEKRQHRLD